MQSTGKQLQRRTPHQDQGFPYPAQTDETAGGLAFTLDMNFTMVFRVHLLQPGFP